MTYNLYEMCFTFIKRVDRKDCFIEFKNVKKNYIVGEEEFRALDGINLRIK